jgi:hypothetical protein
MVGDTSLEKYLLAHQGQSRFLVVTQSATIASPIILDTGQFVNLFHHKSWSRSSEEILVSLAALVALVAQIRMRALQHGLLRIVAKYRRRTGNRHQVISQSSPMSAGQQLYDCSARH